MIFNRGEKRRLERLHSEVLQLADDAVIITDHAQRIVFFNKAAERMFGYSAQDALGEPLNLLLPPRFHLQHGVYVSEFGEGAVDVRPMGVRGRQIMGQKHDGSEFVCAVSIMRVGSKKKPYFAAIVRDVNGDRKTEEELVRLAAIDALTGCLNRREFSNIAEREALRARRYASKLSVMLIDIDHFRNLNELHGQDAGDKILQRLTALCCGALRNVDVFARWGGEEFIVLLPETDVEKAQIIAERLRKETMENAINHEGRQIAYTVSIGIAGFKDTESSIEGPVARAQQALNEAKRAGRNQVSIWVG